ncbi:MAG: hypothetical protein ACFFEF_01795 [Candidatus Thorarchaeota archaeon]
MLNSFLLVVFIFGILALILLSKHEMLTLGYNAISRAKPAQLDLNSFVRNGPNEKDSKRSYIFSEVPIVSMAHKFKGRFDHAILSWDTGPILEYIIEKKYPANYLPERASPEDIFQASLYALALKEKGVSVTSTQLVIIYCLQDLASTCPGAHRISQCSRCRGGRVFKSRFNEKATQRKLKQLDEVWYKQRKPRPNPSQENCRICSFGKNGICPFSAV